ncbi:MAG: hypothetical protein KTR21_01215 [Rhodobacteraceae bacterium]|nr:hypothetical protein [Paracoccaceae bacterium]
MNHAIVCMIVITGAARQHADGFTALDDSPHSGFPLSSPPEFGHDAMQQLRGAVAL